MQLAKADPSKLHWKAAVSVAVKLKLADVLATVPVGPDVMVVFGAVLSTVTVMLGVVVARFDVSVARAAMVAEPSAMDVEFQLKL